MSVSAILKEFAKNPTRYKDGGKIGFTAILHTWDQKLRDHFHLGGPEQVLEYLGRYVYRVAISNNRILDMENNTVAFSYKDRKNDDAKRTMALDANEFIRRFLLHALPKKFMRIRHCGFLANRCKKGKLNKILKIPEQTGPDFFARGLDNRWKIKFYT